MTREVVHTDKAPKAIGPYSQAIKANGFVFTAGQVGINPATGQLVEGGIAEQTRQVLTNLSSVLEAAGTSLANAVKTTVFLRAMSDFQAMNKVYTEFFPANPPARSTIGDHDLPLGAQVEIEVIALLP
jgi:2-iminobutanoate/2-iminopropanoate deaminase